MEKKLGTGSIFVASGLMKTFSVSVSGVIILGWLSPEELGSWQSVIVFVGYLQILSLGTSSGLNREISFYIGKGQREIALRKVESIGYFITRLSLILWLLLVATSLFLFFFGELDSFKVLLIFLAFTIGISQLAGNFLQSTFRSSKSFRILSKIQVANGMLFFLLLPMVYYWGIKGYVFYQLVINLTLLLVLYWFRPFKLKYRYSRAEIIDMVKVGMPMYFWNYLQQVSRSIPRLALVIFTSPVVIGLFSPAGSVNTAMLALPKFIGSYLFPQMSGAYGKTGSTKSVANILYNALWKIGLVMVVLSTIVAITIPYAIEYFLPNYIAGIIAVQVAVFSGVFYCLNTIIHNAFNALKTFKQFKLLITLRFIYIIGGIALMRLFTDDWLLTVSAAMVISEMANFINYIISFNHLTRKSE